MEVTEPSPEAGAIGTAAPLLPDERHAGTSLPPPQQPLGLLVRYGFRVLPSAASLRLAEPTEN